MTRRLALVLAALLATLTAMTGGAEAQRRCTADFECQRTGLRDEARCVGNTLVVRHSSCVGGMCRDREILRQDCTVREAGRCIGTAFESMSGRCDSLLGRCVQRADRDLCLPSCTCEKNVLTIATSQCSPNIGCHRATVQCETGCTCDPTPRCLEAPAGK